MDHLVREPNYLISQLTKLLMSTDDHFRGLGLILETELVGYRVPNCLNWNPSQGGLAGLEGHGERGAAPAFRVSASPTGDWVSRPRQQSWRLPLLAAPAQCGCCSKVASSHLAMDRQVSCSR